MKGRAEKTIDWLSDRILGHFWVCGPGGRTCILCGKRERVVKK